MFARKVRKLSLCLTATLAACGDGQSTSRSDVMLTSAMSTTDADTTWAHVSTGEFADTTGTGASTDATTGESEDETESWPPYQACTYKSTQFDTGMHELDVPKGSATHLVFAVPGLPAPERVQSAALRFRAYDLDHPGEEGLIFVNGNPALELPAHPAWANLNRPMTVKVTGMTTEGTNVIAFGPGSVDEGTFYRIGEVSLDISAAVTDCAPEGNFPKARQIAITDATFTRRHNWVLRCDLEEDYAFTTRGSEQAPLDCSNKYQPDDTRTGTATFTFPYVAAANYRISVRSRHNPNRNPEGTLVVIADEARRIDQTTSDGFVTDVWGVKHLAGTVRVVVGSDDEDASDSVAWVRIDPL